MANQLKIEFYQSYGILAEDILAELKAILDDHDKTSKGKQNENRDDLVDDLIRNPESYLSAELLRQVLIYKKNNNG